MKSLRWLLVLPVLLAACPSSDSGDPSPPVSSPDGGALPVGGGNPAATAACQQTAPLYCQRYFACSPEQAAAAYGTEQACEADDAMACRILGTLPDSDKKGIANWAACNQALATHSCENFSDGFSEGACNLPPGTRPNGQGCLSGVQCASQWCKFPPQPDTATPDDRNVCGTCASKPVAGDPCVEWFDCSGALACSGGKCVEPQAAGGACEDSEGCQDG